jgi:hypothetical protein
VVAVDLGRAPATRIVVEPIMQAPSWEAFRPLEIDLHRDATPDESKYLTSPVLLLHMDDLRVRTKPPGGGRFAWGGWAR